MSWPDSTIITPVTAYHQRSYVETYSRCSPSFQRSPLYAATIHPCSPNPLGRYPSTLPRAYLAQRLVSPLWRHDDHDGFYRGSARQEFGLAGDVCDLSREGGTCAGG